jgi:hypothetical protein
MLVVLSLLAPTASVRAADAKAQAQAALREGNALLGQGHAVEALAKFKSAFALFPSPKLYYNVGQAESLIPGHEAQAYDAMSRFLSQAKDANPELRTAATTQRAQLRSKIGVVTVVAEPADAQLVVDGAPVDATQRSDGLVLGIGVHGLTLRTDAGISNTEQVLIAGGETKVVHLRVAPPIVTAPPPPATPATPPPAAPVATPAPAPVVPPSSPPQPTNAPPPSMPAPLTFASAPQPAPGLVLMPAGPQPQQEQASWTTSRKIGAALLALGAASLVVGVIEHVRYFDKADEFKSHGCGTSNLNVGVNCRGLNDDFNSAKTMWVVGYAGAVALGGLGTYLVWPRVEPSSGEAGGRASVSDLSINLAARF